MNKLGDKIYEIRKVQGLTQEELGYRLGVSRQTISQWEANQAQPKLDKLNKICHVFNMDINYFLSESQPQPNNEEICVEVIACEASQENTFEPNGLDNQSFIDIHVDNQDGILNDDNSNSLLEVFGKDDTLSKNDEVEQTAKSKRKYFKLKIVVAIAVIALIVSIAIVVACYAFTPTEEGFETSGSFIYNFDIKTIAWLIFGVLAIITAIVGIILAVASIKRKK